MDLLMAAVIGLILALIVVLCLRGQLKTVRRQSAAADYVKKGSFRLTAQTDRFMYKKLEKTRKEDNSSPGQ